ncbi:DUF2135 domain-containing protein [Polaribacter vadi]|uniref:VIT domain-containing protein n=1 Tax=Polaribacter TaxID=52959 RepID=UPI001C09B7BD|nr:MULTISPECIES: VIT domain-containing protein [Polaribacter]MBU3010568.1 DUF2135 domain-containing protein [Polaribacter vadi]MDO6740379.1 VIT domain-containing protein [Polaribacter sp. 1_MG-2023]
MKKITLLLLFIYVIKGYSQKSPALYIGKKQLELSNLDISVKIVGNIATTTFDMSFYNASSRVLEGSLKFPLGENQEVSRLALEMNGILREAVVVEKELGRIAFEEIVRRRVDPALLEKGKGNTYNLRVYPIPARGSKRVVIAYEQELLFKDNAYYYHLPFNFKDAINTFNLSIVALNQKKKPIVVEGEESISFSTWQTSFKTSFKKENYIPNKSILIKIPVDLKKQKLITTPNYFYFYKTIQPKLKKRDKPKSVSLFWDVSLSMKNRNLDKETDLLEAYFKELENVEVQLVLFSNTIICNKKYHIKNGNWTTLKNKLGQSIYDGATSYKEISNLNTKSDVIILSSDGLTTLSNPSFNKKTPVFLINSNTEVAHNALNYIAKKSKGGIVNLNITSIKKGLSVLNNLAFQYLGFNSNNKNIEVYPSLSSKGVLDFSVAGKNYLNGEKISFLFGYGNVVSEEVKVILKTEKVKDENIINRIWAKNKLATLLDKKKENKTKIIDLATSYSLVTDYTSLIVLENVQDYIKYNIIPPKELLVEYNRLKNTKKKFRNIANLPLDDKLSFSFSERIEVVEDEREIEETVIESTESDEGKSINIEDIVEVVEEEVIYDVPFMIIEEAPTFPNCTGNNQEKKDCFNEELQRHIQNTLNLELINLLNLTSGRKRIHVLFKISKTGLIQDIRVRAPHLSIKNEIIRVLNLLPRMIPGKQNGMPVDVKYTMPITIQIDNSGKIQSPVFYSNTQNQRTSIQRKPFKLYKGDLKVVDRILKTPYLTSLSFFKDKESAYLFYLTQRQSYQDTPHYYIDVSDFFYRKFNDREYSDRILSNVAEFDAGNYELLRAFAYKLEERDKKEAVLFIYQQILELRPEDAQSYRDLALAYQSVGLCQKAFDLFLNIVNKTIYDNNKHRGVFKGLQDIAKQEIIFLIDKYKDDLDLEKIPKEYLSNVKKLDLRVVLDWNQNDTDIDLHIIDPNLEECFYKHSKTQQGGRMSSDMTQGFGPEEFVLEKAKKGFYYIKIKYYGDRKQKIETPTFMKVTIYKNQGKENEEKTVRVIRLTKQDKEEIIAKIKI